MEIVKGMGLFLGGLVALTAPVFWMSGLEVVQKNIFGVASVNADRRIFETSQAYNQGMVRDLENLQMQYVQATPEQKTALKATILHRFAGYDQERLPVGLRKFYSELRGF